MVYKLTSLLLLCGVHVCLLCAAGSLTQLKLGFSGFWRHQYNKIAPASFEALGQLTGVCWADAYRIQLGGEKVHAVVVVAVNLHSQGESTIEKKG
jgi:hypothetical protein